MSLLIILVRENIWSENAYPPPPSQPLFLTNVMFFSWFGVVRELLTETIL